MARGRSLHPLFDTAWYLDAYPDVAKAGLEPLRHFLMDGWREGRRPHPLFDTEWYLAQYADIKAAGMNPWLHYVLSGWREGRSPDPRFDASWYLKAYLSPADPSDEPLAHYLQHGWREGLLPSANAVLPKAAQTGTVAPLLWDALPRITRKRPGMTPDLRSAETRGTLVLVLHETVVGGAPHVLKQFAQWVRDHTRFGVRLVSLAGATCDTPSPRSDRCWCCRISPRTTARPR